MHLSQDIKPISYLKAKTADVINSVNENQRRIIISHTNPNSQMEIFSI